MKQYPAVSIISHLCSPKTVLCVAIWGYDKNQIILYITSSATSPS